LAIESTLLQVSLLLEEDTLHAKRVAWPMNTDEEIRNAVLAAVAVLLRDRPYLRVEWSGCRSVPLDGKPGFGRCAVCNQWVYDCESPSEFGADGLSRGAKVNGQFRCDEHLPYGHPLCFAGRGYDGPAPSADS
jgi:hypothetical protein